MDRRKLAVKTSMERSASTTNTFSHVSAVNWITRTAWKRGGGAKVRGQSVGVKEQRSGVKVYRSGVSS